MIYKCLEYWLRLSNCIDVYKVRTFSGWNGLVVSRLAAISEIKKARVNLDVVRSNISGHFISEGVDKWDILIIGYDFCRIIYISVTSLQIVQNVHVVGVDFIAGTLAMVLVEHHHGGVVDVGKQKVVDDGYADP